jgi:hypothetical protein
LLFRRSQRSGDGDAKNGDLYGPSQRKQRWIEGLEEYTVKLKNNIAQKRIS